MILQHVRRNSALKPSGPGALCAGRRLTASQNSSGQKASSRSERSLPSMSYDRSSVWSRSTAVPSRASKCRKAASAIDRRMIIGGEAKRPGPDPCMPDRARPALAGVAAGPGEIGVAQCCAGVCGSRWAGVGDVDLSLRGVTDARAGEAAWGSGAALANPTRSTGVATRSASGSSTGSASGGVPLWPDKVGVIVCAACCEMGASLSTAQSRQAEGAGEAAGDPTGFKILVVPKAAEATGESPAGPDEPDCASSGKGGLSFLLPFPFLAR